MASKRRLRRKACTGKRQYATHDEALHAAHMSAISFNQRLSSYKCTFGNHYHVGHTPKRVRLLMGH